MPAGSDIFLTLIKMAHKNEAKKARQAKAKSQRRAKNKMARQSRKANR